MQSTKPSSISLRQKARLVYQQDLTPLLRNHAAWLFTFLWLLSTCLILLYGHPESFVGTLTFDALLLLLTLLTLLLTPPPPTIATETSTTATRIVWLQLAVILLFILLTGYYGLIANTSLLAITLLHQSPMIIHIIINFPYLINIPLYFIFPMIILLLLKARWQDLGFGHGTHTWRVVVLWTILPLIGTITFTILVGWRILPTILRYDLDTLIGAGFVEEFLFRGALLTRLRLLIGTSWSVVLSSLLFGLWHLGTNLAQDAHGNYILALAFGIFSQSVAGLCLSIVFIRTRNLIASTLAHTLLDVLSNLFG